MFNQRRYRPGTGPYCLSIHAGIMVRIPGTILIREDVLRCLIYLKAVLDVSHNQSTEGATHLTTLHPEQLEHLLHANITSCIVLR